MARKKVLHIIQSLDNGGWENALLRLLPLLTDEFEHYVITLRELGELAPQFAEKGIPVTAVHWKGFLDFAGYQRLLSETHQFAPDVVITYLFHADAIGRIFLQKKISAPLISFLGTTYNYPKYWPARIFERLTKKYVCHYLANSPAVRDFYVKEIGILKEKITTISTGIDTEYFDNIVLDPKLRESLGVAPDDFVIICVANLHPNKGHRYILEAFEQLHNPSSPSFQGEELKRGLKLLLIGDGTERENLERQTMNYRSKKNILFLGRRTDVPKLLRISDCFVLPTLFEGMSNAIMEAMASGLPVITTDIPENKVLIRNGETGILVATHSTDEIADNIRKIISSKSSLGENARNFMKENFSIALSARKLSNFLSTL
jgi:glycosyltransferase involved in cell wall biosynthesis